MLNAHPSEGETPSFKGSMLIVLGEKEEDAWEVIRNDIYTKSGVWDLNAAQVIPVCHLLRLFFYVVLATGWLLWAETNGFGVSYV
jgi:hypothetical protein